MSNQIDRSRRGFFTGSLLTREGKQKIKKQITRLGLIPPELERIVASGQCSDCSGPCLTACPEGIIKRHGGDHELHNQPWLDFEQSGCTFCAECNQACPALQQPKPLAHALGKARISQQDCYTWSGIVCMSCVSACPLGLIEFEYGKPDIRLDDCTGCGFCVKVCPASAIQVQPA